MHKRRKLLKISASLIWGGALPTVTAPAFADDVGNKTPRVALVIGNSGYRNRPLENPVNDANAIAKALSELGFQCQLITNATLQGMAAAIQSHGEMLAQRKAVGLFYYAGHGAQLAWRNYLVPVDASIATLEDIPQQALELNFLLQALKKASNPMNVIILDACRDNPFGTRIPLEQKGLSQFDAPTGSLLSYATAPGNTASDGDGGNGLFTENLLREMKVNGAKLEDVFKRVRLQVRLKSNGQQVPWESTSLEQDFYFSGAAYQSEKSEVLQGAKFEEELTAWYDIKDSSRPELFSSYLMRYPNGNFSQLAQVQLDRILKKYGESKVELVSSSNNPYSKGTSSIIGRCSLGDSYTFEQRDPISKVIERRYTEVVSEISDSQIIFNNGEVVLDLIGNELKSPNPRFLTPAQLFPAEYAVGAKWNTKFGWLRGDGVRSTLALELKIVSRQPFSSPAGNFHAFKVMGNGWVAGGANFEVTYWIDPDKCMRLLQLDMFGRPTGKSIPYASKVVLVNFSQKS